MAEERKGTYSSHEFVDPVTKRKALVVLLDTRSFRDNHLIPSVGAACRNIPVIGRLAPLAAALTRLVSLLPCLILADFVTRLLEHWTSPALSASRAIS